LTITLAAAQQRGSKLTGEQPQRHWIGGEGSSRLDSIFL